MWFSEVVINKKIITLFEEEIKKIGHLETGGILLGYLDSHKIYITKASNAGPKAIHDEIYFKADPDYIDMFIDMEVANSDGRIYYLGEWHTHPQIEPYPSTVDLKSITDIASSSSKEFALLLILGAINFSFDKFEEQSIFVIKFSEEKSFFKLPFRVLTE